MAKAKKLPLGKDWEVDLVVPPGSVGLDGAEFIVVELNRHVRLRVPVTSPHEDFDALLLRAALRPDAPCTPARPKRIRCRPEARELFDKGAKELGASVDRVDDLNWLQAVLMITTEVGPSDGPMVTWRPSDWRPLLAKLWAAKPWTVLGEEVLFRLHDPEGDLDEVVVHFVGGDRPGFVVHETPSDLRAAADAPRMSVVAFAPAPGVPESTVRRARIDGLVYDGRVVCLYGQQGDARVVLDEVADDDAFTVLQTLTGAWEAKGAAMGVVGAMVPAASEVGPVVLRAVRADAL